MKIDKLVSAELEMGIVDALFRIKREYKQTEGQIYLSFSGGKDSTVVAALIKMANLPVNIPFVFANTGIELNATLEFVKAYDYPNVQIVKPRKPAPLIWKEDGKPILAKGKSELMRTMQRSVEEGGDQLDTARGRMLISGEAEKAGVKLNRRTKLALAQKHFHLIHQDLEYKVANRCCHYMKKMPFKDFAEQNEMNGTYTGIRVAEGGMRALAYKSCVSVKKVKGKDFYQSMPIFDWSDEMVEEFIAAYDVEISDAYTVYGLDRTGCMACPFSKNLVNELKALYDHEPGKYRASMKMLGEVYMDSLIELPWDEKYMDAYRERQKINDIRRAEMLDKHKDLLEHRTTFK